MSSFDLKERFNYMSYVFDLLQDTNSIVEKRDIVNEIPAELRDDFDYILECLNGIHVFGYKMDYGVLVSTEHCPETWTIRQVLEYLQEPMKQHDLSHYNIDNHIKYVDHYHEYLYMIVNRELKLGIGKSILAKDDFSAMLAKKYEGDVPFSTNGYYITEKLDGNRCIARYDGTKWVFTSRNGKPMYVNFDMSGLPTDFVYDGEVLSPEQVEMSKTIYDMINKGFHVNAMFEDMFNNTSGSINRHSYDKKLVFNIFDIQSSSAKYKDRREYLDTIGRTCEYDKSQIRILPVLAKFDSAHELNDNVLKILDKVTNIGGEGLMINLADSVYEHKRTNSLIKLKKVQTMDLKVIDTIGGTGKYEGLVGSLECIIKKDDGKIIHCFVGSGLSDEQRYEWSLHPELIKGHIVEVAYFSISQEEELKGSNFYSLRFPRLKQVRTDKVQTSED